MDITLVSPLTLGQNALLLAFPGIAAHRASLRGVVVPVLANSNYSDILNRHTEETASTESFDHLDREPVRLVGLGALVPANRRQQVLTVCLKDFPSLKPGIVEHVLDQIASDYEWTMAQHDHADDKVVFVRFASVAAARAFRKKVPTLRRARSKIRVIFDPYITEEDEAVDEKVCEQLRRIFGNPRYAADTGTEDLDQVMQHYNNYTVDRADLIDVPHDMRATIVRDIIRFRSKMVTVEKERRRREMDAERRRAKVRLMHIAKQLAAEPMDDDDGEVPEEFPEMDDDEYEKYLAEKHQRDASAHYRRQRDALAARERQDRFPLEQRLERLRTYELALVDNKAAHVDAIKAFDELDVAAMDPRHRLYFENHPEYVRLRKHHLLKEQEADAMVEEDKNESVDTEMATTTPVADADASVVVAALPVEALAALKTKIGDLVEEYLGIREADLIAFIVTFLHDNNLQKRAELTAELEQTLDEDAEVVVDQLWSFVNNL